MELHSLWQKSATMTNHEKPGEKLHARIMDFL